jgi:4-amino-4-deoxy-L-arabinose transferase-like glycosyltransferase
MNACRAVFALAALLAIWNLWGYDLWAPDEPYFAEGAREMVVDGHWAVPHVNGAVSTDKPPLFFWLIALFSLPLGRVTSLTARLPSALAALGSVALTCRLGRRLAGPRSGALAALILATTYLAWDKSRSAQIDALLCFLILAALSAFEAYRSGQANGRRAGLLFWFAIALAVLAKGPVGLVLPLGIALVCLAVDRRLGAWSRFAPLSGPLLFLAIISLWAVAATLSGGGEYSLWGALKKHALERALHGMHHVQPFWYYAKVIPVQMLPWSGLLPGAFVLAWRRRAAAADRFLLVYALFVVLLFTLSTEKRDLYVLPAYPAFALLAAGLLAAAAGWDGMSLQTGPGRAMSRRWVTLPLLLTGIVLLLAGAAVPLAAARLEPPLLGPALALGFTLAAGGAATALAVRARKIDAPALCAAGAASAGYLAAVTCLFPALNARVSARPFALEVKEATAASRTAGEEVLALGLSNLPEAVAFYSDGVYLRQTSNPADLAAHLMREAQVYALTDADRLAALPAGIRERLFIVRAAEVSRRKVLLVSNRPGSHVP